jgi:single-stranded-DNA-specific exonuclease
MACGFSIEGQANLEAFVAKMNELAEGQLSQLVLKPSLQIDLHLALKDCQEETLNIIEKFAPFGEGNHRPLFLAENLRVVDLQNLGQEGQHLKLKLESDGALKTAIAFSVPAGWREIRIGDTIDIVYYPEINEFNGRRDLQLKLQDLKLHSNE